MNAIGRWAYPYTIAVANTAAMIRGRCADSFDVDAMLHYVKIVQEPKARKQPDASDLQRMLGPRIKLH